MTTTNNQSAKSTRVSLAQLFIAGTNKHFPNPNDSLVFGGATQTVAAMLAMLQAIIALRAVVEAAKAALATAVAAETGQLPPLIVSFKAYKKFLLARFGDTPDVLADFGLAPRKARTPLTAEQKAAAAAKAKATREARHTMSSKKKKGIKGNVTATLVVTPASPPPVTGGNGGTHA
jgi:hypothetical protein